MTALDKGKLVSRDQFEEEQDPSWHATLLNGGYSVYLKADKPIAIFIRILRICHTHVGDGKLILI